MPQYQNLLFPEALVQIGRKSGSGRTLAKSLKRGCEFCPQNTVKGIRKIKGIVGGKRLFVWAQSPGETENEQGRELVGKSGRWFWTEMARAGLRREDCDIQNVVRCWPADRVMDQWHMRDPSKEELFCCSIYTDEALVKSKASVFLILGRLAAQQLLGRNYKKDERVFWSDSFRVHVVLVDHPGYFIRGTATKSKLTQFQKSLLTVKDLLGSPGGPLERLKRFDYKAVTTGVAAREAEKEILSRGTRRVSADFEYGKVGDRTVPLVLGFGVKPGVARIFVLDHPEANILPKDREEIRRVLIRILEKKNIRKVLHYGSSDDAELQALLGCRIAGYDYDTNYAEYMFAPEQMSYHLGDIAARRFPQFVGYKKIVAPEACPAGVSYDNARRENSLNMARVPLEKLIVYNGADCDVTKRIELTTKDVVPLPLLHVYMDAAYVLTRMEVNGPLFDFRQSDVLQKLYAPKIKGLRRELQLMAGDPELNPNTPQQIYDVLYNKLRLPDVSRGGKRNTRKETLEILAHTHPFPAKVLEYRRAAKVESTYLQGFRRSAEAHGGRVRTRWWQTGTVTGRGSSGGGRERKDGTIVNLQNIVHDTHLRNMLVSDLNWRELYRAWKREKVLRRGWVEMFHRMKCFLMFDYSQNELRYLAQMSGDPWLLKLFGMGQDIHCLVGRELTGWSVERIAHDKKTRTLVKNLHFGMVYGLQPPGMLNYLISKGVKISLVRVQELMKRYFRRAKVVKEFIENQVETARRYGYVTNLFGFRVPIEVYESEYGREEGYVNWRSEAVNYPIQGGANQLLRMVLALMERHKERYRLIQEIQLEVHDFLAIVAPLKDLASAFDVMKRLMETDVIELIRNDFKIDWKVPMLAEGAIGLRLGVSQAYDGKEQLDRVFDSWCEQNRIVNVALQKELCELERRFGHGS